MKNLDRFEQMQQRRRRVLQMTRDGMSAPQIAAILRTTPRTVQRDRVATGCAQPPARPLTTEELRRAKELLDDGCSICEAARTIGRSQHAVERAFPDRKWTREQVYAHVSTVRRFSVLQKRPHRRQLVS